MLARFTGVEAPEGWGQGAGCLLKPQAGGGCELVAHVKVWQAHFHLWAYIFLSFVSIPHSALMQCIPPAPSRSGTAVAAGVDQGTSPKNTKRARYWPVIGEFCERNVTSWANGSGCLFPLSGQISVMSYFLAWIKLNFGLGTVF